MNCKHFSNGGTCKLLASECKFIHPPCKFFNSGGGCLHSGQECKFAHPACTTFAKGTCKFDQRCKYLHRGHTNRGSTPSSPPPAYSRNPQSRSSAPSHPRPRASTPASRVIASSRTITERTERSPFEIMFLIDVSYSMQGQAIAHCKNAMKDIIGVLRPQDKVAIHTFSNTHTQVLPFTTKSAQKSNLTRAVDSIQANGGTALWDAIIATIHTMKDHKVASRDNKVIRKLFILTDGEDVCSSATHTRCAEVVQRPGLTAEIFLVAVTEGIGSAVQQKLENLGGGKVHYHYKPVQNVGAILEGFKFFKDAVFLEQTVRQTRTVMEPVTRMVPRTVCSTRVERKKMK